MDKLIEFLKNLLSKKFSGTVEITFYNGGIRGFKAKARDNSLQSQ